MQTQLLPSGYAKKYSVYKYIKSIGRYYFGAVTVITLLLGATYGTVIVAMDRQVTQQEISFLTNSLFIRFQRLANQTRALMRASTDPDLPEFVTAPMISDISVSIADIRRINTELDTLYRKVGENLLEQLSPDNNGTYQLRLDLNNRLEDFIDRATRIIETSNTERANRYSFWGPIDFAVSSDSALLRQFNKLIAETNNQSHTNIENARRITTLLLTMIAVTLLLATLFLFIPLLKKLHLAHRLTSDYEKQLIHVAQTDSLTGAYNRASFNMALGNIMERYHREKTGFSLLLIDLDHFKNINDNHGHPAGDAILKHISDALICTFRETDIVARMGGDEFSVLLPGITDPHQLQLIANRAVQAISAKCIFAARTIQVTASIGGANIPVHATCESELVRIADLALYAAKRKRNSAVIFDHKALSEKLQQNLMISMLANAAGNDEYVVYYQPKNSLLTGQHTGFEALVRWKHPEQGILSPGKFLPLIEDSHLLRDMTEAVVRNVAHDISNWKVAGFTPGPVAINLPEIMLTTSDGYNLIADAINEHGLEWHDFAIEITEGVFLTDQNCQIQKQVTRFRQQGVGVSLDDFGTGFASLVHLRDFPFDELKIDKSFVAQIGLEARSERIIRTIVNLSRDFGKQCVAEGIETDAQREFLVEIGCITGQGFLFSTPKPADIIQRDILATQQTPALSDVHEQL